MTLDKLLTLYSPVTFYATEGGGENCVRLDYGHRSFPGVTVDQAIKAFLKAMEKDKKCRKDS